MILVTVGSSEFKFNRLFEYIDKLCDEKIINGDEIIAQMGYSDYNPNNYKKFSMLNNELFKKYVSDAEYIIMHAGVGTIINSIKQNKKVIVVPRIKKYNEHVDNHQLEIAYSFEISDYLLVASNYEELKEKIKSIKEFKPNIFISNNDKINDLIIDLIERN